MAAYEVLLLNTAIPQIQAAQSGDTYVVPRDIAFSAALTLSAGTANGVPYLNGSKVVTTGSALTFDGSTFKVATANSAYIGLISGATKGVRFGADTVGGYVEGVDNTGVGSYQPLFIGGSDLRFLASGSEQMRLTSTGLGIGTSSPTQKLHVVGNALVTPSGGWTTGGVATHYFGDIYGSIKYDYNTTNFLISSYGTFSIATNGTTPTTRLTVDSSGNLGLGVTPSASWSGQSALQVNTSSAFAGSSNFTSVATNAIATGTGWTANYLATGTAALYTQSVSTGAHAWYTAASGNAGDPISFTQAMTLDASGNLVVGGTSAVISGAGRGNVTINGSSTAIMALSIGGAAKGSMYHNGTDVELINYHSGGELAFYVNGAYRARITSGGDLLVKKTSSGGSATGIDLNANGFVGSYSPDTSDATVTYAAYSNGASAYRFYVGWGGTVFATNTTISAISDQRFKENIRDLDIGLNAILALKPRKFDWKIGKGKDKKDDRGFIAQEFEQVFPDLVDQWADPAPEGEEPYKSVRQDLIPVLVKAIQEQQAMINELKAEVAALKGA